MRRRCAAMGLVFSWLLLLAAGRLLWLAADPQPTAGGHGFLTLTLPAERGTVTDRAGRPLTNRTARTLAALTPTPAVITALHRTLGMRAAEEWTVRLAAGKPLLAEVPTGFAAEGAFVVRRGDGVTADQPAVHLVGYLNGEGRGVCGVEAAFEELLDRGPPARLTFAADARGGVLAGVPPTLRSEGSTSQGGVALTLELPAQQAVEQAVEGLLDTGAVVVLDVSTGEIRAALSRPVFDPTRVAEALQADGSPLLNRTLAAYNTGSVFKLAVAAAALEQGFDPDTPFVCTGEVNCGGQTVRCHKADGHGELTLRQALAGSCNAYFIQLAAQVGADAVLRTAAALGLGQAVTLAPGMTAAAGSLPEAENLASPAALAHLAIGQGALLTTPLQIAALTAAIAGDGTFHPPQLIDRVTLPDGRISSFTRGEDTAALSPATAAWLRQAMVEVVSAGTGQAAAPLRGGAGGKTATAQTGWRSPDGGTMTQAWFTGFFPAEEPQYVVTVLVEGGTSGAQDAAPVFAAVANALDKLTS